jgi:GNAT superfamily N-acetyltransferase
VGNDGRFIFCEVFMIINVNENNIIMAAEIHSISWKKSHESICTKEFIDLHTTQHQKMYLCDEINLGKCLYMLIEDKAVGIVSVHESLMENLYILPEEQRKGYGSRLLEFAIQQCKGIPTLWILESNYVAYSLYSKYGFQKTGIYHKLSDTLSEIEMKRAI